jgi:hypothetical protein
MATLTPAELEQQRLDQLERDQNPAVSDRTSLDPSTGLPFDGSGEDVRNRGLLDPNTGLPVNQATNQASQEEARKSALTARRQRLIDDRAKLAAENERLSEEERALLVEPIYDVDERTSLSHVRDAVQHYLSTNPHVSPAAQQVLEKFMRDTLGRMREIDGTGAASPRNTSAGRSTDQRPFDGEYVDDPAFQSNPPAPSTATPPTLNPVSGVPGPDQLNNPPNPPNPPVGRRSTR